MLGVCDLSETQGHCHHIHEATGVAKGTLSVCGVVQQEYTAAKCGILSRQALGEDSSSYTEITRST